MISSKTLRLIRSVAHANNMADRFAQMKDLNTLEILVEKTSRDTKVLHSKIVYKYMTLLYNDRIFH